MTNPTPLSPAAEAVLNAVTLKRYDAPYYACPKSIDQIKSDVAAALRAAALYCKRDRLQLIAIAEELEAT
jgi:hypothetical protein